MAAKKRMIDPGIWTDPQVLQLSSISLLVFIGMISHADDEGIIEADPDSLYFRLARKDITSEVIRSALCSLSESGLIYRYGMYAYFPNWFKHQNLKGRKPQKTKLRRPPEESLTEEYIQEWLETFTRNSESPVYPVSTCYIRGKDTKTTSESLVSHQCATSESPVTPEVKGSEVKGSEYNIPTVAVDKPQPKPQPERGKQESPKKSEDRTDPLYHSIKDSFLAYNESGFSNWGKEGKAIHGIIDKCARASPDDPAFYAEVMIKCFWDLKASGEKFYRDQPFTPSTLNASGIWDRVAEQIKLKKSQHDDLELYNKIDIYGIRATETKLEVSHVQ